MTNISLFGWLDRIPFWRDLPYPVKGGLLRLLKALLSGLVGVLLAAATAGTLLPATASPIVVLLVTAGLQAADKYLRERKIAQDAIDEGTAPADTPVVSNDATDVTNADPTVDEPIDSQV